jgi:uncharacterized membrane protein (DUF2068 family)
VALNTTYRPRGELWVAVLEASKGLLIILAGCGVLALVHADLQDLAEQIVTHFHLNPGNRYPRIFLDLAANVTDRQLWTLAGFAFGYASLRFIEALGLWFHRVWAEWLAALSGGVYVPFEIYELAKGVTVLKVATLVINLIIVAYMSRVLFVRYRRV